ncbi:GNAT family N-acetyltransferase [Rugosimonospora acidiphila]|uniref:GNAT family N-acetyltransferase n=1 Tax=Rugosimonospora acidiphila TaxID=556531 RepID=A0ABP9SRA7_9ACTN
MTTQVRTASATDAATIAYVVATAFHPLDVTRWLIPDPQERANRFPHYARILIDHAFEHGTIHITTDLNAVAVWLPHPLPDPPSYATKLAYACGVWTPRFQLLDQAMHHAHPQDLGPHDYLAFLAVMPQYQGQGCGAALLDHHHNYLDEHGRAAYLEASNTHSRKLYTHHGYTDCAPPLDLHYQGEPMYPMWRQPPTPGNNRLA